MIWLQTLSVFWLGGGTISRSYWKYLELTILGDWITHSRATSVWAEYLWCCDGYRQAKMTHIRQLLIKFQQNWLKQEVGQFVLRSVNLFILFAIWRKYLRSRSSRSLCIFIRRVKKKTDWVAVEAYHFCQLHTEFYATSCCQENCRFSADTLTKKSFLLQNSFVCTLWLMWRWRWSVILCQFMTVS